MPCIACTCADAPSRRLSLAAWGRVTLRKIAVAVTVRAERRALMSLDRAALKDMGFNGGQAHREYGRSFWDVPCDRMRF